VAGVLVWILARAQESANAKVAASEGEETVSFVPLLKSLGLLVAVAMLTQLLISGMNSFLPLYLVDKHGIRQDVAGLVMALVYGAGVLGAPVGGAISDRFGRKPVILISVVTAGPLIALVTLLPFGFVMVGIIGLYGLFQVFRLPAIESLIADVVPARRRATVLGGYNLLAQQTTGVSTPLFGWLMDQFGLNNGIAVLASVALVSSLLVLPFRRRV
jgi:FSR family fosmidomycin resistance protein-like MFS transporter